MAEKSFPVHLVERELHASANAKQFWSLTEQGALHYRAGRFVQAGLAFEESLRAEHKSGRAVLNWLWLALTEQRLGNGDEARRWLGIAQTWLDRYGDGMPDRADQLGLHLHNWLEAHVLRSEAEALLGVPPIKSNQHGPRSGHNLSIPAWRQADIPPIRIHGACARPDAAPCTNAEPPGQRRPQCGEPCLSWPGVSMPNHSEPGHELPMVLVARPGSCLRGPADARTTTLPEYNGAGGGPGC
jgi:hypothetical protein